MQSGETLKLVSNCPGISDDLADWVKATGYRLLETDEVAPGEFEFYIGKRVGRGTPMRIKSHWFKAEAPKTPQEIACAAAFIIWRVAQNALKTMRAAKLRPAARSAGYFAFLAEFLAFLTLGADRLAHARGDERLARRLHHGARQPRRRDPRRERGRTCSPPRTPADIKRRFVEQVNAGAAECAGFDWTTTGPTTTSCAGSAIASPR